MPEKTEKTCVFYPSLVEILFRLSTLFIVISILWLLIILSHNRNYQKDLHSLGHSEQELVDIAENGVRTEGYMWMLGLFLYTAFAGYSCFTLVKRLRNPIKISSTGITTGESKEEIPFEKVRTMLFTSQISSENTVYLDGILVVADNTKDSTLDKLHLLSKTIDEKSFSHFDIPSEILLGSIRKIHLYRNNEAMVAQIASALLDKNTDCSLVTAVDKFRKQRVVMRKKGRNEEIQPQDSSNT